MKKLLLVALISLPVFACIDRDAQGYVVRDGNKSHRVNVWDMDKSLSRVEHKMNPELYKKCVDSGLKIKASRLSDGSYYLRDKSGLNGGGPWLAAVTACVTAVGGTAAAVGGIAVSLAHGNVPAAGAILFSAPAAIAGATLYASEVALVLPTP